MPVCIVRICKEKTNKSQGEFKERLILYEIRLTLDYNYDLILLGSNKGSHLLDFDFA